MIAAPARHAPSWATLARAAAPALLFAALLALCWWYLAGSPLASDGSFSLGAVSSPRLDGLYGAQTSDEGLGYRWTDGDGRVALPAVGPGPHVLAVTLSAPRLGLAPGAVPVTLSWNGAPLAQLAQGPGARRHSLLLPAAAVRWGENTLGIASPTFRPGAGDRRDLGVAVFAVGWRSHGATGWLPLAQAAAIAAAATALVVLLRRAGIPPGAGLLAAALLVAILVSMRHSDPRFARRWAATLLTGGLALMVAAAAAVARPQPGEGRLPWRAWARLHWPALAGYVALTALMFLPILARLTSQIPGHPGDAFEYLWKLELFSDYLLERRQSPTFLPELMYPEGFELANSEITPANTLLGLPLTRLLGPIASFNLLNLASYVLSGFFSYLLIHRLGAGRLAAFVGGIVFAFTVRRYFQMSAGHLPLMPTQYLPLALYGLEGMLTRRRMWDAFVAAAALALATWASLYYGTTFALFMAAYALLRTGLRPLGAWLAATWRPLVLAAVVLAALVAPFAQPYLEIRGQGASLRHSLFHLSLHAAHPGDYLPPNPYHPLWGAWARPLHRSDGGEHVVTLGYSVMALSAIGLWAARPRRLVAALAALMAATFVLTLGPTLYLPGGGELPLPALFIYEHVPILDGIRVWNRVVLYIVLCAAVLTGLALSRASGRRYYALSGLAAAALLFELAAASPFTGAGPRAVDVWLGAQAGPGAAIELPPLASGTDVFYASYQGRPSSVWYGTFTPPLYAENEAALDSFPGARALDVLERWQVRYVIVDERAMAAGRPGWEAELAAAGALEQAFRQDGFSVYVLRP